MSWTGIRLCTLCCLVVCGRIHAISATSDEMASARAWLDTRLVGGQTPPFSFTYADRPSAELLKGWEKKHSERKLDDSRTEHTLTWVDPQTKLTLRCVVVVYRDFPTVEWTLHFRNAGAADTPILADIQSLDARFERGANGEFVLHHHTGSPCQPNDYEPHETVMPAKAVKRISAAGGRPTNSDLSCFNLTWPDQGVIIVVGWPGQWAAEFSRDEGKGLRVRAGQELTRFRLQPGEEVRSPLMVLQFYMGDRIRSQNIWRRWMVAHNLPRPGGKLVPTHYGSCFGNLLPRAEEDLAVIEGFLREGIKLDYWFIDAGWYPNRGAWHNTGTWEVDASRFPRGLREVADRLHATGTKFVLWFEPERVTPGTWLYEKHPEWLLGKDGGQKLLNLGHPEAWKWVVEHFDSLIVSQGVDVYRQDFNMDPLSHWRGNDAPDRQGITENHHVTGYLAYWDELLRRHPDLFIDTCASGGRRNDLETLRRSVPLLRSDYFNDPTAQQSQTYGISLWMPYYGSGMMINDVYWYRSCIFPASRVGCDTRRKDLDYPLLHRMIAEFRKVEPFLLGDFYPLTPHSLSNSVWMAWQYDRPEQGAGVVQVFRRPESVYESARFPLRGLDTQARYVVTNLDDNQPREMTGRELADRGLLVSIPAKPAAVIFMYKRQL